MILFLDTSALVKVYIAEPGSERMREAVARDEPKAASFVSLAGSGRRFEKGARGTEP